MNLLLLIHLDHLPNARCIVYPVGHYLCHLLELLLISKVLNTLTALELDAVSLIGALFLEALDAIPVDTVVGVSALHHFEVDCD